VSVKKLEYVVGVWPRKKAYCGKAILARFSD